MASASRKYLDLVSVLDEREPVGGLAEHRKHCEAEPGECPFEKKTDGADVIGNANARTERLAPNGKRSNLTERQWHQVRTPEFKAWFGDWEANILHNLATRAWEDKSFVGKFVFEPSRKLGDKLKDLIGHDINEIVITADSVRHMKNHHGDVAYEASRGQVAMTSDDVAILPYVLNNFDAAIRDPTYDLRDGNKAVTLYKRINGVSVVTTISKGKDKQFVVSGWKVTSTGSMPKNLTPNLNALSDVDLSIVQQGIAKIKRAAKECSKVVDENGEPLVVYHGTGRMFNSFRTITEDRKGSYFTDRKEYAKEHAETEVDLDSDLEERVISAYLSIRRPCSLPAEFDGVHLIGRTIENAYDKDEVPTDIEMKLLSSISGVSRKEIENDSRYDGETLWFYMMGHDFANGLLQNGYDGLSFKEYGGRTYAVFSPSQIKSATDNTGSFDPNNPDIRY